MSLLEKIKMFVSNEELLFDFIDVIKKIHKIQQCDDDCDFNFF